MKKKQLTKNSQNLCTKSVDIDNLLPKNIIKELQKEIDYIDKYISKQAITITISCPVRIESSCDIRRNDLWFDFNDTNFYDSVYKHPVVKKLAKDFKAEVKRINNKIKKYAKIYNISEKNIRQQLGIS